MGNDLDWLEITNRLLQAADTLGMDITELKGGEQVDQLRYYAERFSGERLSRQTASDLRELLMELWDTFGEALSMRFLLGASTLLQVGPRLTDDQVENLLQNIHNGVEPTLDLTLDKYQFVRKRISPDEHPNAVIKLFFFADALCRAISVPLTYLEHPDQLWYKADDQHRLIIIIPENEIHLSGEFLVVLGGKALGQLNNYLKLPEPASGELVKRMRDQALDPLSPVKWIYFKLKYLTPIHLQVDGVAAMNDPIAEALYTQLINLCLIYSADRTKGPADDDVQREGDAAEWRVTFTEQGHTIEAIWDSTTKIPEFGTNRWDNPLAWCNVLAFAYNDKIYSFEKLKIIQLTVAHSLENDGSESSYDKLVTQAPRIQKYVYDSWQNFVEEKIKEYFAQLRDIESTVDTVTEKFQEQVDTLTRTVFENALTAVGVLIGTFIAAAFQDKFNPWIFWIGVIAYLSYLIIFPHWLGLKFLRERFDRTVLAFDKRCRDFKNRLNASVVDDIVGDVVGQWRILFNSWHKRAQSIYRVVAFLLLVIAFIVTAVTSNGLMTTAVSATGTPTQISNPTVSETSTPIQNAINTSTP